MSRILFTTGHSPLSRAIRSRTGEPCSHVALECAGWVVHSNLFGVRVDLLVDFLQVADVVYELPVPMDAGMILSKYLQYRHSGYDFGALMYLFLRSIPGFKFILPEKNLWKSNGMFLCTEWATQVLQNKENSVITPYQLYLELSREQGV